MASLLRSMNGENLVQYFIFPMIGIPLGEGFLDVKLHKDKMVVRVRFPNGNGYFTIPKKYEEDVDLFRLGLYTEMSEKTKELICHESGLMWEEGDDVKEGKKLSDSRLLALYKDKDLRRRIAEEIGADLKDIKGELLSPPKDSWFYED